MATIKQVCELAGVSAATVSRVINGSDRVIEATRKKVQAAMDELGYQPNLAAQALASNRSNTIGMVISGLDGPFYGTMMAAVEAQLRELNRHLLIASGHGNAESEEEAIKYLSSRQVDGLILLTEGLSSEALLAISQSIPVFLINQQVPGLENRNVWLDNFGGAYRATQHLIEQGHRNIVCIGGPAFKQDANDRVAGFETAMRDAGLDVSGQPIFRVTFGVEGGRQAMNYFREQQLEYSAVVAGSDETAVGVYEWAEENGLVIPDDFSVIGFDNMNLSAYVRPKLSTVAFPIVEMAKASARMAFDVIYNKAHSEGVEFNTELVLRNSVKAL
ncbi:LacI family DNA-binding transcriptional regulator [Reinekea marinisedimentorum]|uniref:LacI family transcriptional regulator n=1 Tax=Reinekea marinisedimentorum TaxID=230495 RepID=A0A4R3I2C7_9GAMM|nr:LacI family DNA-binding transcriptional regulator [Reinekea marinisedimentorum]TCS38901.1 LacI family transcriptional regulator [Reinekea marinisedimentorum]